MSHRGNANKIASLRNAVVGYEWATEPLSRIATHVLSFQQLHRKLESAPLCSKESNLAILRDKIGSKRGHMDVDESRIVRFCMQVRGNEQS